ITMDDDLQNPPEEVVRLYDHARLGGWDVVYTRYAVKQHAGWRNLGSRFANAVADRLLDKPRGLYLSSFRCMSALVVRAVTRYSGPYPYVDGLVMQVTQRIDSIEVRHLFYNVPVRKKFLKSVATELGHVCETVTRLALGNPTLHLVLRHNGKLVYEVPASAGLADRIGLFFGGEVRDALYEVDSGPGRQRLVGFIADPKCDRGNAKLQYLFVNGRWFRDRSLGHALQESYRGLLMTGRYAVGFLFLTVPPDSLDVNVHPTKAEVRFQENSLIYSLVRATVKNRLLRENLVPHIAPPTGETDIERREAGDGRQETPEPGLFSPRQAIAERTVAPWEMPAPAPWRAEVVAPVADPFAGLVRPTGPAPRLPIPSPEPLPQLEPEAE
ncbi:MAG: hypothetical protein J0H57_04050, partial [Rhodospirillales bacterium]|nr:hypothetical protein [Rhodospirillales bacterium]